MPRTARTQGYKPASGNRTRPIDRLSPVDVPSMGRSAVCNYNGDDVKGCRSNKDGPLDHHRVPGLDPGTDPGGLCGVADGHNRMANLPSLLQNAQQGIIMAKKPKQASTARNLATPPISAFEAKLWAAADALRNNMDAAEYKHVVLGLIFLKYISDAFEAKHAELEAQRARRR